MVRYVIGPGVRWQRVRVQYVIGGKGKRARAEPGNEKQMKIEA